MQVEEASGRQHPQRRGLDTREQALYSEELVPVLESLWAEQQQKVLSWQQLEALAQVEFRLGKFFRKKMPSSTYQPYCRHHLQNSIQGFQLSRSRQQQGKQRGGDDGDDRITHWGTRGSSDSSNNDMEMARFWLATTTTKANANCDNDTNATMSKCPAEYIVGLYASFSNRFDAVLLDKLEYQTPHKLCDLLVKALYLGSSSQPRKLFHNAVDLGCGTGLSGIEFRPLIRGLLTGIDLSPAMIEMAKEKRSNVYSKLMVGDLTMAFCCCSDDDPTAAANLVTQAYDLVIACDVFCYLGDLNEMFTAVQQSFLLFEDNDDASFHKYVFSPG